jgi:endonuclease-3
MASKYGWNKDKIKKAIDGMQTQSPPHHFEFTDPFWILITTIMSHRTKDQVTDKAARGLFEKYKDCEGLSNARYEDVLKIIDKVGFKTVKANRVIEASRYLKEHYNSKVPDSIEQLTEIKGVGRKTANVVLADGFNIPTIAVDTHVQRISKRLGWTKSDNPDETEIDLKSIIPKELWLGLNPMMVEFGKNICKPIGPRCTECKVQQYCSYYNAIIGKDIE